MPASVVDWNLTTQKDSIQVQKLSLCLSKSILKHSMVVPVYVCSFTLSISVALSSSIFVSLSLVVLCCHTYFPHAIIAKFWSHRYLESHFQLLVNTFSSKWYIHRRYIHSNIGSTITWCWTLFLSLCITLTLTLSIFFTLSLSTSISMKSVQIEHAL